MIMSAVCCARTVTYISILDPKEANLTNSLLPSSSFFPFSPLSLSFGRLLVLCYTTLAGSTSLGHIWLKHLSLMK